MFKTEAEAWEAIADTLEMIEGMPEWAAKDPAEGLCEVIFLLGNDRVLVVSECLKMRSRIQAALGEREWLAKRGAWQPRVAIARKFAKQARNNS